MHSVRLHAVECARPLFCGSTRWHRLGEVLLLPQPGKVDKRTGDHEADSKTSGQKAVRYSTCATAAELPGSRFNVPLS